MKKFKPGDIVIFDREATEADWSGIGKVDVELLLGEKYTIKEHFTHNQAIVLKEYINGPAYPASMFSLANPLKLEINKLKETILNSRITITKEERKLFESLCSKLDISINKYALKLSDKEFSNHSDSDWHNKSDSLVYKYTASDSIKFKDLIEPFKKFRDEIL